jgi:hypothetical protein
MRQGRFITLWLSLAVVVSATSPLYAIEYPTIFGCSLNPASNPETCLNNKMNDINRDAGNKIAEANKKLQTAEDKLKQLENSPNFARLRGEQLMLQSVRNLQLEPLIMCLENNRAQIDLNQYAQRASTNPGEFTRWLFEEMWRQVEGDFDRVMAEDLAALRQASPEAMQSLASPDAVFVKLQRIADRNPSARCLVEYLAPRMQTLKQSSQALQGVLQSRATALVEQRIKPILNELLVAQARGFMDELRRSATQGTVPTLPQETGVPPPVTLLPQQIQPPVPSKQMSGAPTAPLQQAPPLQQDSLSTMGVVRKRGLETDSPPEQEEEVTSRGLPAPRTVASLVWEFIGPDDIKIIAQGVFGRHLLNTANMQQASGLLRDLPLSPPWFTGANHNASNTGNGVATQSADGSCSLYRCRLRNASIHVAHVS